MHLNLKRRDRFPMFQSGRGMLHIHGVTLGTPDSVFEGVNALKGFVHYYDNVAPLPGVDANRTLFHVRQ